MPWPERGFIARAARIALPLAVAVIVLGSWEWVVRAKGIAPYVLPAPSAIWTSLVTGAPALLGAAFVTLRITLLAFALAVVSGVAMAVLFAQARVVELALAPYAIALQVTPVIAVAPLIVIWVGGERTDLALLILAWMVAFFPILAAALLGFRSVDHQLEDLFDLYGASPWQRLVKLRFPTALPHVLAGMKVAAGLALIGCVGAEFAAGSGSAQGLAWRIIEAGNRLEIARMFACLLVLALMGVALYYLLTLV